MANEPGSRYDLGLPIREFMYTLDQIAFLLSLEEAHLRNYYIHWNGRSVGVCPKDKIEAFNIAPAEVPKAEWRVPEKYLKRWMRFKGFRVYDGTRLK